MPFCGLQTARSPTFSPCKLHVLSEEGEKSGQQLSGAGVGREQEALHADLAGAECPARMQVSALPGRWHYRGFGLAANLLPGTGRITP